MTTETELHYILDKFGLRTAVNKSLIKPKLTFSVTGEDMHGGNMETVEQSFSVYQDDEIIQNLLKIIRKLKHENLYDTFINLDETTPDWWSFLDKYGLIPYMEYNCNSIFDISMKLKYGNIQIPVTI